MCASESESVPAHAPGIDMSVAHKGQAVHSTRSNGNDPLPSMVLTYCLLIPIHTHITEKKREVGVRKFASG